MDMKKRFDERGWGVDTGGCGCGSGMGGYK